MTATIKWNRMECAGSLGDLGTLIPLGIGLIVINGLDPVGVFWGIGLYYIFSGLYFKIPISVEPMKVVAAYSIGAGITTSQIHASCLWLGVILFVLGVSGLAGFIGTYVHRPVVRGLQLSTGILLVSYGLRLMIGVSLFGGLQSRAEPFLRVQVFGGIPIGIAIGILLGGLTLLLLENRKLPAALVIVAIGLGIGILWGTHDDVSAMKLGLYLPNILSGGFPSAADFNFVILALVLPQIPMTMGNAVIATADLAKQYFPQQSSRVSHRNLCLSMAFANVGSFLIGGMPMCHGAGGLASRYRFGGRTAGANLIIGILLVLLVLFLGPHILVIIHLLPLAALGVLLLFAGLQLALTISDITSRSELFIPLMMLGITLTANLAVSFLVGVVLSYLMKWRNTAV